MDTILLRADSLRKVFNRRTVFSEISFDVSLGHSVAITGRNGSGKSTLAKILAGVLSPSSGKVILETGGSVVAPELRHEHVGFVSPYLQLYEEFSALENLRLCASLRGLAYDEKRGSILLDMVGLSGRKDDQVRTFSSGMKQRLKYGFALLHEPVVLILDEPTANLDAEGVAMVRTVMTGQRSRGVLVIATNDEADLRYADAVVSMEKRRVQ